MDEIWNAWAAGFFDGEGCIRIFSYKNNQVHNGKQYFYRYYTVKLIVGQKDRVPLDRLVLHFGGSVTKAQKGMWHWQLSGAKGIVCLQRMLPYLTVKLPQANLAIEYWETRDTMSDEQKASFAAAMSALKTIA